MELEAIEPPHCLFSYFGNPLEHLVAREPFIIAYPYRSGVNKGYARTFPQTACFQKAFVGHGDREFGLHMPLHIEQVKVFHTAEPA